MNHSCPICCDFKGRHQGVFSLHHDAVRVSVSFSIRYTVRVVFRFTCRIRVRFNIWFSGSGRVRIGINFSVGFVLGLGFRVMV